MKKRWTIPSTRYHAVTLELFLTGVLVTFPASAIVRLANVPDTSYQVAENTLPALVDLPYEGHGTLIAPRWVVTAAHAVTFMLDKPDLAYVTIAGKRRAVEKIIQYPDYAASTTGWKALFDAMKTSSPTEWKPRYDTAMSSMHDIALLKLKDPVTDIAPLPFYRGSAETGQVVELYGAGATGTSTAGVPDDAPHRGQLRRAKNRIIRADGPWIRYTFDCGADALPREGVIAGGDSGGPVVMMQSGKPVLVGLAHGLDGSLKDIEQTKAGTFRLGVCGQTFASTRVAFYVDWINRTMAQ